MTEYTFSTEIFSDLHKDAYGFRPRGHHFYDETTTDAERQQIWDYLCQVVEDNIAAEREHEARALRDFEADVTNTIELGAGDRETALRWMTSGEDFYHEQDVEHWVWNQGILFTDEGRQLVKDLMNIVTFEKLDAA
jgi:hypothetical protein